MLIRDAVQGYRCVLAARFPEPGACFRGRRQVNLVFWLAMASVVLLFDYTNGFHDTVDIVATMIASRAMVPAQAVLLVGFSWVAC
jgi:hypothetical protein